ncbi:putative toxin-antitoxin system toxin component, PIN family [Wenzhouxiangella sp. EGI_FJ10409]|uniref:putative toxin-antitoxin system toxin component, PIN family n=1 Tax=Wenzhouxiangella sp. EGI_FJ10409 TaxID=3243767 RepID=UPI0035DD0EF2
MTDERPLTVVVDTNILISRLLAPQSAPARALSHAVRHGRLLASSETLAELAEVLGRAKFDRYLSLDERQQFMRLLGRIVDMPPITHRFSDCRDPSDNKFLDLAVSGQASVLITGDRDLLELHPFRGIPIITPASYLHSTPKP